MADLEQENLREAAFHRSPYDFPTGKEDLELLAQEVVPSEEHLRLLRRLVEGNRNFVLDQPVGPKRDRRRRMQLAVKGQSPWVIFVVCSDSRVVPSVIFDLALGSAFTVAVPGNIHGFSKRKVKQKKKLTDSTASPVLAGVEYAVEHFISCPDHPDKRKKGLLVVLTHDQCGAILAALNLSPKQAPTKSTRALIKTLRDHIGEETLENPLAPDSVDKAIAANGRAVLKALTRKKKEGGSPIIRNAIKSGLLMPVLANYSLDTGKVEFILDCEGPNPLAF